MSSQPHDLSNLQPFIKPVCGGHPSEVVKSLMLMSTGICSYFIEQVCKVMDNTDSCIGISPLFFISQRSGSVSNLLNFIITSRWYKDIYLHHYRQSNSVESLNTNAPY